MAESRQGRNANAEQLKEVLSGERIGRYVNASGHDVELALKLYVWNLQLGESFFPPLQAVEVALRNRVSAALQRVYGSKWWKNPKFLDTVGKRGRDSVEIAIGRLRKDKKHVTTGRIVADLSFGFWLNTLSGQFNRDVWSKQLRQAFPHMPPNMDRKVIYREVRQINDIRNRIFHHEPIFSDYISHHYARCLTVLGWLSPEKKAWLKPSFRVPDVMRSRPRRAP